MIPNDVFICDWHYERADLTAAYFALKGFPVATCGYRQPEICLQQIQDQIRFRNQSAPETAANFQGYIHTIWSGADSFLNRYYALKNGERTPTGRPDDAWALLAVMKAFTQQN